MQESGENLQEDAIPKLQLSGAGGGGGAGPRCALGGYSDDFDDDSADDEDVVVPEIDNSGLPDPPKWFNLLVPIVLSRLKAEFQELELREALIRLEQAHVPPIYRLGLGFRWKFIRKEVDFSLNDFGVLLDHHMSKHFVGGAFHEKITVIEIRSAYQIWKTRKFPISMLF